MKLTASMSETLYFPNSLVFFFFFYLNAFIVIFETHTLFVSVTVQTDWSIHVHRLAFAHAFEVRSAFGGAIIPERRERWTRASEILKEFSPKRLFSFSMRLLLQLAEIVKNSSDSQIRKTFFSKFENNK